MDLMLELGETYYDADDYYMSKLIALKILENKEDEDARSLLGKSYYQMNQDQLAYETLKKVLQANSGHSEAINFLRKLYKKYGNPKYKEL